MAGRVTLIPLTEEGLTALLELAVADADPLEVMPPVPEAPGWNGQSRLAFVEFHRKRSVATETPLESTYLIDLEGEVVGAARLEPCGEALEAGIWIGRSNRGAGIGTAVLRELVIEAARIGGRTVHASTTAANVAAQRVMESLGFEIAAAGAEVRGVLFVGRR